MYPLGLEAKYKVPFIALAQEAIVPLTTFAHDANDAELIPSRRSASKPEPAPSTVFIAVNISEAVWSSVYPLGLEAKYKVPFIALAQEAIVPLTTLAQEAIVPFVTCAHVGF